MNLSSHPVVASLTPVFLLIALGYLAGRRDWIRASAVKDLSNLVFLLLIPALLFRTMSGVHVETLDLRPLAAYFPAALLLLAVLIALRGFNRASVVMALGGVFSNMVMIGIPLVELAYGKDALVTLLTLVSVHALILLTVGSVVLELVVAGEARAGGERAPHVMETAWTAFKGALIHPIPLPILSGLLFAQTGLALPAMVDKPLQLLGTAFGPIALVLVGVTLARTAAGWVPPTGALGHGEQELAAAADGRALCLGLGHHRLAADRDGRGRCPAHGRQCVPVRAALRRGLGPDHRRHGAVDGARALHPQRGDARDGLPELSLASLYWLILRASSIWYSK